MVSGRHFEQVFIQLGEIDELLPVTLVVGADQLEIELTRQALRVGSRIAAAVEEVLVYRHVVVHVVWIDELRRQVIVEPLASGGVRIVENIVGHASAEVTAETQPLPLTRQ